MNPSDISAKLATLPARRFQGHRDKVRTLACSSSHTLYIRSAGSRPPLDPSLTRFLVRRERGRPQAGVGQCRQDHSDLAAGEGYVWRKADAKERIRELTSLVGARADPIAYRGLELKGHLAEVSSIRWDPTHPERLVCCSAATGAGECCLRPASFNVGPRNASWKAAWAETLFLFKRWIEGCIFGEFVVSPASLEASRALR